MQCNTVGFKVLLNYDIVSRSISKCKETGVQNIGRSIGLSFFDDARDVNLACPYDPQRLASRAPLHQFGSFRYLEIS